jgi:hypothetical protein
MRPNRFLLLTAALVALTACQPKQAITDGDAAPTDSTPSAAVLAIDGTVNHIELEGGFWVIRGDDGAVYDPTNGLPEAFRTEGLKVSAHLRPRPDMTSIHQMGTIVEIVDIQRR